MGNWVITIEGTGSHHNAKPYDANEIGKTVVKTLKEAGHNVTHASINCGGRNDLINEITPMEALSNAGQHTVEE